MPKLSHRHLANSNPLLCAIPFQGDAGSLKRNVLYDPSSKLDGGPIIVILPIALKVDDPNRRILCRGRHGERAGANLFKDAVWHLATTKATARPPTARLFPQL